MLKLMFQYFGLLMQRTNLPGASVRNSAMAKVMRKEASAYAKRDQASGNPLFQSI